MSGLDIITNKPLKYPVKKSGGKAPISNDERFKRLQGKINEIKDYIGVNLFFTAVNERHRKVKKLGQTECFNLKTIEAMMEMKKDQFFETGFCKIALRKGGKKLFETILRREE